MLKLVMIPFTLIGLAYNVVMAVIKLIFHILGLLLMVAVVCLVMATAIILFPEAAIAYLKFKLFLAANYNISIP